MNLASFQNTFSKISKDNLIELWNVRHRRLAFLTVLLLYSFFPGELGEVTRLALFDAYIQVTVFVAATLLLFFVVGT